MNVLEKLNKFYEDYPFTKGVIGKTERGRDIFFFVVKKSARPVIICQYAIHAREHITTHLALKQIENHIRFGRAGKVYFVPMLNVDGVDICIREKPLYKANVNMVDLNVNFDARWGTGEFNKKTKGDQNYIGVFPFSESETRALKDFTLWVKPDITISYHCKGEEIYYEFFQDEQTRKRDFRFAKAVSKVTGYKIKSTPNSAGGYKDWCIEKLGVPALTIEVGSDRLNHPIMEDQLDDIFKKNKGVLDALCKEFLENYSE